MCVFGRIEKFAGIDFSGSAPEIWIEAMIGALYDGAEPGIRGICSEFIILQIITYNVYKYFTRTGSLITYNVYKPALMNEADYGPCGPGTALP